MPEYDATAGVPSAHVEAFKRVAARNKMVISSRELTIAKFKYRVKLNPAWSVPNF
jgi:hypothetical protein